MTQGLRFQSDEAPSALLVQNRRHPQISFAGSAHLRSANHAATLRQVIPSCESPPKYPPRSLAILTHLITGEAYDNETIERYVDRMQKGDEIDPIEVSDDGSGVYTVWQGHHRVAASGRCSFTHIPVIIHAKLITRR